MPIPRNPSRRRPAGAAVAAPLMAMSLAVSLALSFAAPAHADKGPGLPAAVPKVYTQECGSCHIAYPPGLLPARSWQRVMTGLDKHFGSDASLDDAATVQQLSQWLQASAANTRKLRTEPPQDRITRADWFVRKHRRVDAAVWAHASVKSAANCAACHPDAERGDFDEHALRTPPGLDARLTRGWRH